MNNQITFGSVVAAIILATAAKVFFHIPMTISLTILIALAAIRYLPSLIGQKWTSAVVTVVVLFLLYSTVCWVAEQNLPFSTRMKPFGIQSLDNTMASWINRPGVRGEQSLLDSLFRKEEQTDPEKVKEAFKEDPLEAARLLGQQQRDGQVIRDMANPFKKPVDIAQYRLQRAEKDLRDRTLVMQALAKEAKATQIKGTIIKEVLGKDKKKNDVRVFKAGDRVTLASTKAYTKKAVLMVAVYGQDGQISSVPYSYVKFDPIEPEVAKKEEATPAPTAMSMAATTNATPRNSGEMILSKENNFETLAEGTYTFVLNPGESTAWKKIPSGCRVRVVPKKNGDWAVIPYKGKQSSYKKEEDKYVDYTGVYIFKVGTGNNQTSPLKFDLYVKRVS